MNDEELICDHCDEPIPPAELRHVPFYGGARPFLHYHVDCLVRTTVGSVAHQEHRCSCYGGTGSDDDDPSLTKRETARAAAEHFRRTWKER